MWVLKFLIKKSVEINEFKNDFFHFHEFTQEKKVDIHLYEYCWGPLLLTNNLCKIFLSARKFVRLEIMHVLSRTFSHKGNYKKTLNIMKNIIK